MQHVLTFSQILPKRFQPKDCSLQSYSRKPCADNIWSPLTIGCKNWDGNSHGPTLDCAMALFANPYSVWLFAESRRSCGCSCSCRHLHLLSLWFIHAGRCSSSSFSIYQQTRTLYTFSSLEQWWKATVFQHSNCPEKQAPSGFQNFAIDLALKYCFL